MQNVVHKSLAGVTAGSAAHRCAVGRPTPHSNHGQRVRWSTSAVVSCERARPIQRLQCCIGAVLHLRTPRHCRGTQSPDAHAWRSTAGDDPLLCSSLRPDNGRAAAHLVWVADRQRTGAAEQRSPPARARAPLPSGRTASSPRDGCGHVAQDVAERLGREAELLLFRPHVLAMDAFDVTLLPTERLVLLVASTTGQVRPTRFLPFNGAGGVLADADGRSSRRSRGARMRASYAGRAAGQHAALLALPAAQEPAAGLAGARALRRVWPRRLWLPALQRALSSHCSGTHAWDRWPRAAALVTPPADLRRQMRPRQLLAASAPPATQPPTPPRLPRATSFSRARRRRPRSCRAGWRR